MAFCTECGKKINDGEICSCQMQQGTEAQGFEGQGFEGQGFEAQGFEAQGFEAQGFGEQTYSNPVMNTEQTSNYTEPAFTGQQVATGQGYTGQQYQTPQGANQSAVNVDFGAVASNAQSTWTRFKNRVGIGTPESNNTDMYEREMQIVPDTVDGNEGEIPIKQYNFAILRTRLSFTRAEGRLQVTNKRVLFRAAGRSFMGRTVLQHEFAVEEIAGIEVIKNHKPSFLNLIGALLLNGLILGVVTAILSSICKESAILGGMLCLIAAAASMVPFFMVYKHFVAKFAALCAGIPSVGLFMAINGNNKFLVFIGAILLVAVGITWFFNLLILFFIPNLEMIIKTKGALGAVEVRRTNKPIFPTLTQDITGFAEILPWDDTEDVIAELGAMIEDIQNFGDAGIEKWKN